MARVAGQTIGMKLTDMGAVAQTAGPAGSVTELKSELAKSNEYNQQTVNLLQALKDKPGFDIQ